MNSLVKKLLWGSGGRLNAQRQSPADTLLAWIKPENDAAVCAEHLACHETKKPEAHYTYSLSETRIGATDALQGYGADRARGR